MELFSRTVAAGSKTVDEVTGIGINGPADAAWAGCVVWSSGAEAAGDRAESINFFGDSGCDLDCVLEGAAAGAPFVFASLTSGKLRKSSVLRKIVEAVEVREAFAITEGSAFGSAAGVDS